MAKGAYIGVPTYKTSLCDLEVGSTITLNVGGVATEFLIVQQGNPDSSLYDASCDGTWLLMTKCHDLKVWDSTDNDYANSDVHGYLNGEFLSLFDSNIQNAIKQVKLPYCVGLESDSIASKANGLSTKVFLLSGYEVGFTTATNAAFPIDGAKLDYFEEGSTTAAKNLRIAYKNTTTSNWWLRSPKTADDSDAWYVASSGVQNVASATNSLPIRPAVIFPSNLAVTNNTIDGSEAGYTSIARKVKMCYLGIPIGEGSTVVTADNVSVHFRVVDDAGGFAGSGGVFSSSADSAVNTSETTWTAKRNFANVSLDYVVGSKYLTNGKFTITVAGNEVVSSTTAGETGSWSGSIKAGETIVFYSKNGKTASAISNIAITEDVQAGETSKSYARKIKKAYIGVNGVAQLCYTAPKYTYTETNIGANRVAVVSSATGSSTKQTVYYSDSFTFDDQTGLFTLVNPSTISIGYSNYSDITPTLRGKYFVSGMYASGKGSHTHIYKAPDSGTAYRDTYTADDKTYYRTGFDETGRKYTSEPI